MRIALRELRRRPGRFLPVGVALTVLVVLLTVLGGFLDGLEREQTGAFRIHEDRLWVLTGGAELQLQRSALDLVTAETIAAVDGVAGIGGIGVLQTTATTDREELLLDVAVVGYERAVGRLPAPPGPGEVVLDRRLLDFADVREGDVLAVGPEAAPLRVIALVDDATQGAPTLWTEAGTWRALAAAAAPAGGLPDGAFQALVVQPAAGVDPADLAVRVDAATGSTQTVDVVALIDGQPVIAQQSATFEGIIAVTFLVTLLVAGLFFALLTLERVRLYAVLKAVGGRTADLVGGVAAQAAGVTAVALALGLGLALAVVAVLPPDLPIRVLPGRVGAVAVGTLATAVAGALLTLRRILRIDPAAAVG